uniref:Uncharacterized protein n=1 Tax=viral metagenome TaxID=1070528 RepID=A0A6C0AQL2_9ZZZZ
MTTPYAVSTNIGSVSYNNYVNAPITGPLSTSQTPCQIPYHSYGILAGIRPTPPQFYPSQDPVYAEMNSNARHQYSRTAVSTKVLAQQIALGKMSLPQSYIINSSQRQVPVSSHTNYIPPIPSSMYVNIKKSNAVGQTAYKVNLPNSAPTGTKSYYPSGTRSTIRRARSGGCVAPKKKGAIENYSLSNGRTCAWGSIVRQNY